MLRRSLEVEAVYLEREFYDGKCPMLLQAHNYAYVTPIVRWGKVIQQELDQGWSQTIEHDLKTDSAVTAGPSNSLS